MVKLRDALADSANVGNIVSNGETPLLMEDYVWRDILGYTLARRLDTATGHIDYNFDEGSIDFDDGANVNNTNDAIVVNYQLNHDVYRGTGAEIRPHIHYWQTSALAPQWKVEYRIQNNSSAKVTAWTSMVADGTGTLAFPYVSGTLNQITSFGMIPIDGVGLSSTIQVRMWRTGNSGDTDDVGVTFFDAHAPFRYQGSQDEFVQ